MSKASQSWRKRAPLSEPSLSIAPERNSGLFARMPTGRPSIRTRAVTMPRPNSGRSSSTLPVSANVWITSRMSYTRRRFSGTIRRSSRWSGQSQSSARPWKYDRYRCAAETASISSSTAMSTTPFGTCTSIGPTSSGRNTPRPPPSISAGPPIPMLESAVAMITSQQPSNAALPAKQKREVMPTIGTRPLRRAKEVKVGVSRGR